MKVCPCPHRPGLDWGFSDRVPKNIIGRLTDDRTVRFRKRRGCLSKSSVFGCEWRYSAAHPGLGGQLVHTFGELFEHMRYLGSDAAVVSGRADKSARARSIVLSCVVAVLVLSLIHI